MPSTLPVVTGGYVRPSNSSATRLMPFVNTGPSLVDPFNVVNRINAQNASLSRPQSIVDNSTNSTQTLIQGINARRAAAQQATGLTTNEKLDITNRNRALSGLGPKQAPAQTTGGQYANPKYNEIANYARQGGWAEQDIPMAIAIAMAESSGNPLATNDNYKKGGKGVDRGLWQVNDYWQRDNPAVRSNPNWGTDPVANAKAALQAFKSGGGWTPWSTFKGGQYKKFLQQPVSMTTVPVQKQVATASGVRGLAVQKAQAVIGLPYVWGGNSLSKGVDCSGLVQQVYKSLGINLPRTADQQSHFSAMGSRTTIDKLQPGDLVAWQGGWRGSAYVGHIAIYAGNGRIIEAPDVGLKVRERALTSKDMSRVFGFHLNIG